MRSLTVLSYGPEVAALDGERGVIGTVSSKGVYLLADGGAVVGLVDALLPDGPLQMRVVGLRKALHMLADAEGGPFACEGGRLDLGGGATVDFAHAVRWIPSAVSVTATHEAIAGAARALRMEIARRGVRAGFGLLPANPQAHAPADSPPHGDAAWKLAARHLGALSRAWQRRDTNGTVAAALGLLGLGPGLTPSGDDLLAGLLAAAKWLEHHDATASEMGKAMCEVVALEAPTRTARLSARLLAHAANGLLYEPAMSLGAALFAGRADRVVQAANRLFEIGHTSGADLAAGVLLGALLGLDDG